MKLIKVGDLIHNHLGGKSTEVSYVMVDTENKYYKKILNNKEFLDKYSIQKCKGIVNQEPANVDLLEIDQIVTSNQNVGIMSLQKTSKIIEIIDDLIITDSNLFIVDDITAEKARQMEEEGQKIIKLNIGNVGVFGFDPPEEIQLDMIRNLGNASAYSDSKGIFAARKAIMHYCQQKNIQGVTLDDIYLGNGASELIVMATNALLNDGDEMLLPAPDYPLWTAAVSLSGGTPVHYMCDESNGWMPDIADIRSKITPNTKGIVVINPNNPTGALYSDELLKEIVQVARERMRRLV